MISNKPSIILFSYQYSFKPLLVLKFIKSESTKIICPRGELHAGALAFGKLKKIVFLKAARFFRIYRNINFHATSDFEADRIKKLIGKSTLVSRAVNLSRTPDKISEALFNKKKKKITRLIYIGRINPIKNLLLLLEVLSLVNDPVQLRIIGHVDDQRYWSDCQKKINQLSENKNVVLLGALSNKDTLQIMKKSDCLCLLSNSENFGQVIYEALSLGIPVLTSNFTPWNNLELKKAGWNIDIDNVLDIRQVLQTIIDKTEEEWLDFQKGALNLAVDHHKQARFENAQLFLSLANLQK